MSTWSITRPGLDDEERAQVTQAGGLAGRAADTDKLLGVWDGKRKFTADPVLGGLQRQTHIYAATVSESAIKKRRARNKQARKSKQVNRRRR